MTPQERGRAWFSLSQTQRRLAHEAKREAEEAERDAKLDRYRAARKESDRLWQRAKEHLALARREFERGPL